MSFEIFAYSTYRVDLGHVHNINDPLLDEGKSATQTKHIHYGVSYWQIAAFNRICGQGSTEALKAFNVPLDFFLCSLSRGFSSDILYFFLNGASRPCSLKAWEEEPTLECL